MKAPGLGGLLGVLGELAELHSTLGIEGVPTPGRGDKFQGSPDSAVACPERSGIPPEMHIQSRLEVRTGRLLANVCRETECIAGMLRELAQSLGRAGVDEAFLGILDELIQKLKDAQAKLASARDANSPAIAVRWSQKGRLYDLTRKLVWIGRLEFLGKPGETPDFESLRRERPFRPALSTKTNPFVPSPGIPF